MRVPFIFFIKFWLVKSLMAIGTGFVIGHFSKAIIHIKEPPINTFIGMIIFFLIYQFVSLDLFFGSRRGEFEYECRKYILERVIRKLVFKYYGFFTFINYFQDRFNEMRPAQKEICKKLLKEKYNSNNKNILYCIYYKLAELDMREDNFTSEKMMLKSAISIKPVNVLSNFRFARCCEMDDKVDEAISFYNLAQNDENNISAELKRYIQKNIVRVEQKGLMKKPTVTGAKYQSY